MKILFLGSSPFSLHVLNQMEREGLEISSVITQPDRPSGRGHKLTPTEVNLWAKERNIPVYTFDKMRNYEEEIKGIDYDIAVVASYGQILPIWFLEFRPCINVHPSLLPKYRGATPIQSTILNGDKEGGVTIMKVAMEVDAGDIILQKAVPYQNEYYAELEEKLGTLGGSMVAEVLKEKLSTYPQNHAHATFCQKLTKEDGNLDFSKNAEEIVAKVRALADNVGCYIFIDDLKLKVIKAEVSNEICPPCQILNNKKKFVIGAKNGAIEVTYCLSPSGKTVRGQDFLNGHSEILGKSVKC